MRQTGLIAIAAAGVFLVAPALAAGGPLGIWQRQDGKAKVQIAPCDDSLCGTVVWLRETNGPGKIGERVFFDMKPTSPTSWEGGAYNPEDGRNYSGSMVLAGNTLTTKGCALGGMICRSFNWSRSH